MKRVIIACLLLAGCGGNDIEIAEPLPIVEVTDAEVREEYNRAFLAAMTGYSGNSYYRYRDGEGIVTLSHSAAVMAVRTLGQRKSMVTEYITAHAAPLATSPPVQSQP